MQISFENGFANKRQIVSNMRIDVTVFATFNFLNQITRLCIISPFHPEHPQRDVILLWNQLLQ